MFVKIKDSHNLLTSRCHNLARLFFIFILSLFVFKFVFAEENTAVTADTINFIITDANTNSESDDIEDSHEHGREFASINESSNANEETIQNLVVDSSIILQESQRSILAKQQEFLRSWFNSNSVLHFALDKRNYIEKKYNVIIETRDLVKLYQARNFSPIWIDQNYQPNKMVQIAQDYMMSGSIRHGLNSEDYISFELKSISAIPSNSENWMYIEIMMSDAFLRMGKDIATGRLNLSQLEKEFKLKRVQFKGYEYLQSAMNTNAEQEFNLAMDKLAPQSSLYKKLLSVLEKLHALSESSEWATPIKLEGDLKYGSKNSSIIRLRQRFSDLGYAVNLGSSTFDDNFLAAVREFQSLNELKVDGIINKKGSLIHALNKSLKSRIEQLKVNLERLRFLPRKMEPQYAWVNTAFAEFNLYENDISKMRFNTVVGKNTRRTPTKRDLLEEVIINPTWTIPPSILKKDKLNKILMDVDYFKSHNIRVLGHNNVEYNSLDIDWNIIDPEKFPYQLVQQPGLNNSLGVVKFPLYKHNDNIYMHDTNEKIFFEPEFYNRHKSSGCVRLEKPLEFAEYLLKPYAEGTWSLETLKSLVPPVRSEASLIQQEIKLNRALPVYLMYLTVDLGDNGQIRFANDIYGQDSRFAKVLNSVNARAEVFVEVPAAEKLGSLIISGEAGPTQLFSYVKAIPCKELNGKVLKASCRIEKAIAFPLNKEFNLPYGTYILGFENSIYPGFVRIFNKPQKLQLEKIQLKNFEDKRSAATYRVVRDFSDILEKSKNPFQTYFVQQPIFNLAQYNFGGLYLRGSLQKDISSRLNYRTCESVTKIHALSEEAFTLCENAKVNNLIPTAEFFVTNKVNGKTDGTFTEKWINEDVMDVVEVKHPFHLVAAPLKVGEFVSVFPGSYRIVDEDGKTMQKIAIDIKDVVQEYKTLFIDYDEKTNEPSESNSSDDQNI